MAKKLPKDNFNMNWGFLSKYRTELMGIAIIWVVLYHGNEYGMILPSSLNIVNFVLEKGRGGVDIFLLLSGLGLYYSFSKDSNIKSFYKKRVLRVIIPYLLIATPFWVLQDLILEFNIAGFIKNITLVSFWSDGYTRLWYFALLLPLYAIFPLIYKWLFQSKIANNVIRTIFLIAIVVVGNCLIRYLLPDYYGKVEIALTRIPVFIIGIFLGSYAKREKRIEAGEIVLLLLVYSYRMYTYEYSISGMSVRYWYISLALAVCIFGGYFCRKWRLFFGKSVGLFVIAGKFSLELYITHVWVRNLFGKVNINFTINGVDWNRYGILEYMLIIAVSCALTFIFVLLERWSAFSRKREPHIL